MKTYPLIKLLRPTQWVKNLMLFFPPFLGGQIFNAGMIQKGVVPFAAFCLASSSTYIFNDIIDRDKDLHHPRKKHRPIPSGKVSPSTAYFLMAMLLAGAMFLGMLISKIFLFSLLAYLIISVSYSLKFKELPIFDLFFISAGFLLRLQAGGIAFSIDITDWLFLSVFLLSIFLSAGKRLCEKNSMGENSGNHRKTLQAYPPRFLDGTLYMTGGTALVTYTMYVISRNLPVYSVPLCCFGILRYIFRVKSGFGGDPTESLLKDGPLFVVALLWTFMIWYGTYVRQ
jgi:decaprenyl-phosphate phosphoribosyltransferase